MSGRHALLHRPRKVSVTSTPWTEGMEPAVDRPSPARLNCNWVFLRESWGTGQARLTRTEERRPGLAPEERGQGGRAGGTRREGGRHLGRLSQATASSCDCAPAIVQLTEPAARREGCFLRSSRCPAHQVPRLRVLLAPHQRLDPTVCVCVGGVVGPPSSSSAPGPFRGGDFSQPQNPRGHHLLACPGSRAQEGLLERSEG